MWRKIRRSRGKTGTHQWQQLITKDKDMFAIMPAFRGNGGNLQAAVQIREKNSILLIRNWTTHIDTESFKDKLSEV